MSDSLHFARDNGYHKKDKRLVRAPIVSYVDVIVAFCEVVPYLLRDLVEDLFGQKQRRRETRAIESVTKIEGENVVGFLASQHEQDLDIQHVVYRRRHETL